MASLREYFELDFQQHNVASYFTAIDIESPGEPVRAKFRVHWGFDSGAKFVSCYVPKAPDPVALFASLLSEHQRLIAESDKIIMSVPRQGRPETDMLASTMLRYTGRFFAYYDDELGKDLTATINAEADRLGLLFELRMPSWAARRHTNEHPLAFISHDSRDKDAIARPLAIELSKLACPVWFDEFSLSMGDSLRNSIEKGLKEARKCILVITPSLLSNTGWTKREFDSIFTREVLMRENVVLPIWHGVTAKEVYDYSPSLADKVARDWSVGIEKIAPEIRRLVLAP